MADLSKQIASLEAALASGASRWSYDGHNVTLRSREDMIAELIRLKGMADPTSSKTRNIVRAAYTKGTGR